MALKHTGLWLTIEGWVDVADIDNDKVFDTKPSHSHPPHPTTKPPPFHPSSLSNSNPLPSAHSTTLPTPLLLHIVFMPQPHIIFFFTINFVGFCQSTNWQRASHTVSKERGGDYRAMASCQGVLSEG